MKKEEIGSRLKLDKILDYIMVAYILQKKAILYFSIIAILLIAIAFALTYRVDAIKRSEELFNSDRGDEAIALLDPIAKFGDSEAQFLLGYAYAYGWGGIKPNDEKAIYWFRRCGACEPTIILVDGMDPAAPHELIVARAYASGDQVGHPDRAESLKWLRRAAAGGSREAITELANGGVSATSEKPR